MSHVLVVVLQSAVVAHAAPFAVQPLRFALQISGWPPLQRVWPTAHVGAVHVPVAATHRAAVAQVVPFATQPLRFVLQISGWVPLQRVWPTLHVGGSQRCILALQSTAVAHVVCASVWPFALHVKRMLFEQRDVFGEQASHSPFTASQRFAQVCAWSCCPSLEQWCRTRPTHQSEFGMQMSHWLPAASQSGALMHIVSTQLLRSVPQR
jgi:hypothetical protein